MSDSTNPAPGWYPDPQEKSDQRYWDGTRWSEERRDRSGRELLTQASQHFETSQAGSGLSVLGAAVAVLACFLPAAEVPVAFSELQSNTLIQEQSGILWLIVGALGVAGAVFRAYKGKARTWLPLVIGAITLIAAAVIGTTHSDALTLYPLGANGDPIASASAVYADPGIGIYVLGLGGLLMLVGGAWIRSSPQLLASGVAATAASGNGSVGRTAEPVKRCPDCAETVLEEARVCKHCGFRFDGSSQPSGTEART